MTFTIHTGKKSIKINSDIVPCCNIGHGEAAEVLLFSGEMFCGYCYESGDRLSKLFWWDLINDNEVEIECRDDSIAKLIQ